MPSQVLLRLLESPCAKLMEMFLHFYENLDGF